MNKKEMTALDVRFVVRELRSFLSGAVVRKIYQYEKKKFMIEFFSPGKGGIWLYIDHSKLFLTEHKLPSPPEPPNFCMFLRKYLMGKRVTRIEQCRFDRIVEIWFPENKLVIELVPPGNVILCDSSNTIIMPLEIQKWKDREVRHRQTYKHPPLQQGPFGMGMDQLQNMLRRSDKSVGAFLAVTLGLGGVYSTEVCTRAGVQESGPANRAGLEQVSALHNTLEGIDKEHSPTVYDDWVSPFFLKSKSGGKGYDSFSQALDEFFVTSSEEKPPVEEHKERVERIIETQKKAAEHFTSSIDEKKEIAEAIYNNYMTVKSVLEGIRKAKDMGLSWEDIKKKIQEEDTPEADAVKEIREDEGVVVVTLGNKEVELDFRLSVEENAARFYEDRKVVRSKLEGVEKAMEDKEKELEEPPKEIVKEVKKKPRKKWYEKFKWFTSSDGFLVIGGKDAKQNDLIYSKYIKAGDYVFHADIPGAALVVIQGDGRVVSDEAKREAAEFSAANSKAWSKGLGTIDVYGVEPEQVSKSPPSGQALAKGSFIITGERKWFRDIEIKLAIGVKIDHEKDIIKAVSGPVLSIRKNSDYFITIKPGFKKSLELARSIKNKLLQRASPEDKPLLERVELEELQRKVPSGMGEIVEFG